MFGSLFKPTFGFKDFAPSQLAAQVEIPFLGHVFGAVEVFFVGAFPEPFACNPCGALPKAPVATAVDLYATVKHKVGCHRFVPFPECVHDVSKGYKSILLHNSLNFREFIAIYTRI
ncbi:MAG TPA: hypothetical protein DIW20_00205 [Rhodospirillaceae bacterium]|nr:hypothetical protein [Rhodospirillaceae bacterium]